MSLLTPEPGLVFWMLISFGIVVFILAKYGFPIILSMVNKRNEYIDKSLLAAKNANEELSKVKETTEALLAEARKKQSQILQNADERQHKMIDEAKSNARLEADKIIIEARKQIEREKDEAILAIRGEIAALSVDVAEKILQEELSTHEAQLSLIDRIISEKQKEV